MMSVVLGNGAGNNLHILGPADLPDKISKTLRHLSVEYLLTVFGSLHQVALEVVHQVIRCQAMLHLPMLLRSPPKGEGFTPSRGTLIRGEGSCLSSRLPLVEVTDR